MGYRIDYGPVRKVRGAEKRRCSILALTGMFFLVFLFLVGCFWPAGTDVLRDFLVPGDAAVTTAAFSQMSEQLRYGADVSDAFWEFCVVILEGAGIDTVR